MKVQKNQMKGYIVSVSTEEMSDEDDAYQNSELHIMPNEHFACEVLILNGGDMLLFSKEELVDFIEVLQTFVK